VIVCHCNQITSGDIDCAVKCMMTNCANADLCPERVYGELGECPRCCSCFPLAERMIQEAALQFVAKTELLGKSSDHADFGDGTSGATRELSASKHQGG